MDDLTQDEGLSVLLWAHRAAAAALILHSHPEHANAREAIEILGYFRNVVASMVDDMPDVLFESAGELAEQVVEETNREEDIVEEFMNEVDAYGN